MSSRKLTECSGGIWNLTFFMKNWDQQSSEMGAAPSLEDDGADPDDDEIIPMASGRLSVSKNFIFYFLKNRLRKGKWDYCNMC